MNKREIFTLYILDILCFYKNGIKTRELYQLINDKFCNEIVENGCAETWKRDCYRAVTWLVERDMLTKTDGIVLVPELVEVDTFEVEEFTVHLYESADVLHVRLKGDIALGGNYSARIDKVPSQDHVHIYKGQNQICSMNADGSGHDGFSGHKLPNKVVKAIKKRDDFKGFNLPPNNTLTLFSSPLYP
ncbi:hypothetical protein F0240_20240 [Vibrio kanaloae]|uniref:hypothetical protein n=1 Tax=Vibrio kanaloae TaxID=170673 RepID=UPI00148E8A19|nr:hypothetical protein [Vibrio kanaloae]NOJ02110.1 hypothetical protein [Vibrio kanaloae]